MEFLSGLFGSALSFGLCKTCEAHLQAKCQIHAPPSDCVQQYHNSLSKMFGSNCQVCYMAGIDNCKQHSPKTYGNPNKDYIDGECEDITDKRSLPELKD